MSLYKLLNLPKSLQSFVIQLGKSWKVNMSKYVAAIDQGTTSTRFMIFDHGGNVIAVDQKEHQQIYPKPGWVEHDPLEIWERTQEVMRGALGKISDQSAVISAIGITNQRETTVVWEKSTGKPIYNAI